VVEIAPGSYLGTGDLDLGAWVDGQEPVGDREVEGER
jgi:hypothetical protein